MKRTKSKSRLVKRVIDNSAVKPVLRNNCPCWRCTSDSNTANRIK